MKIRFYGNILYGNSDAVPVKAALLQFLGIKVKIFYSLFSLLF